VSADDFDAVFTPGGHGPMWDMPDNATSIALIEAFVKADKPSGVTRRPRVGQCAERTASLVKGARDRVHECRRRSGGLDRGRTFLAGRPAKGTG